MVTNYTTSSTFYLNMGFSERDVSSTIVDQFITQGEAEIDQIFQMTFTNANAKTDFLDGDNNRIIIPTKVPIQTVTGITFLDEDGTVSETISVTDSDGKIKVYNEKVVLIDNLTPNGRKNIKLEYTYGYSSVPSEIGELCELIVAIKVLTRLMNQGYDCPDSYSVQGDSMSKGNKMKDAINNLKERRKEKIQEIFDSPMMISSDDLEVGGFYGR